MADQSDDLLTAAQAGDRRAIARLLSRAEMRANKGPADTVNGKDTADPDRDLLERVYQQAGKAHVLGLTGPPGAGKSSLVNALVKEFRGRGRRVGVIAIDPSSPYSGGAILGDRVRMGDLGGDDGVFVRSLATQGAMGGLARPALDVVDVLDAVGFDLVIVETVGVGQDEVDIAGAADTVIVASPPGLGDGVQAMKAGLLEIADIHVITKADRPDAARTVADMASAGDLGLTGKTGPGWRVPVIATSANDGTGIVDLADAVSAHFAHLIAGDDDGALTGLAARRRNAARTRLLAAAQDDIKRKLHRLENDLAALTDAVADRLVTPGKAAQQLIDKAFKT